MPRFVLALVASIATLSGVAASQGEIRLMVGIVVDGLEAEYLDMLREKFGSQGFNRLASEGLSISHADYGTYLDPVAASTMLVTGAAPSVNGIGAATYYDRSLLRPRHVFADGAILGNFTERGYSPTAIQVSTISDEARIAAGGLNVVYAIASNPGVAITLAGHAGNVGIWLDEKTGNWASSTYYKEMPSIVARRNRATPLSSKLDTMSWTPSLTMSEYPNLPDHLKRYPFRYVFPRGASNRMDMFAASPMINREITSIATDLLTTHKLGTHEDGVDVLNIAYNLTAYTYGKTPDVRIEQMDAYVKLDADIAQLLNTIDSTIGLNHTVLYLVGTPPKPVGKRDDDQWGIPHGEFSTKKAESLLNLYLINKFGNGKYVTAFHNGAFYLDSKVITNNNQEIQEVRRAAAHFLSQMTGVVQAYSIDQILAGDACEDAHALRRNTVRSTSGDILIRVAPGFEIVDDLTAPVANERVHMDYRLSAPTAPAFILAPSISARVIYTPVDARAIAPTIARAIRIRAPNGAAVPAL